MADLRIDDASQAAQKARLVSPEGRAALWTNWLGSSLAPLCGACRKAPT